MSKCPRGLKSCEQAYMVEYEDNNYFCFGVMARKGPGGVKMDVIRRCMKTHFHKKPEKIDSTPDEAIETITGYSMAVTAWLDSFGPYNEWRDENDR